MICFVRTLMVACFWLAALCFGRMVWLLTDGMVLVDWVHPVGAVVAVFVTLNLVYKSMRRVVESIA